MNSLNLSSLVPALFALQFAVFGWRIVREVTLGDQGRRTWLLLSDWFNLVSMLAVVTFCVVEPIWIGTFSAFSRATLAAGYVLIAFTPIMMAGHYRLFSSVGRAIYKDRDYPWVTDQEMVAAIIAVLATTGAAFVIATS
jgi:hypothetical protein